MFSCSVVSDSLRPPWTAARQASLSITNSRSLLELMSIESVMPSNRLLLCRPLQGRDGGTTARYLSCLSWKNNVCVCVCVYVGVEIRLAKPNHLRAFNQHYFTNVCKCQSWFLRTLTGSLVCVCMCSQKTWNTE